MTEKVHIATLLKSQNILKMTDIPIKYMLFVNFIATKYYIHKETLLLEYWTTESNVRQESPMTLLYTIFIDG